MHGRNLRSKRRGFALLIVLWFLVLLAATGGWIMSTARSETSLAHNVMAAASAEALADAGVAQAVFHLTATDRDQRWPADGVPHRLSTPRGDLIIEIEDEAGKINPNLASAKLLSALFTLLNIDPARANQLATGIADWVGKDDNREHDRAVREQYQEAGLTYGPPHAPIDDIDSLQRVIGMTPDVLDRARPYLTTCSRSVRPEAKNASSVVKKAMTSVPPDKEPPQVEGKDAAILATDTTPSQQKERCATVLIVARSSNQGVYVRRAIFRVEPANAKGYVILDWKRGTLDETDQQQIR